MNRKAYIGVVLGALAVLLLAVNVTIYQRENLLSEGQTVMLALAPVDPRSLMQGDYMALRFEVARQVGKTEATDGYVVVKRDARNVATFNRVYRDGETMAVDESRIHYRLRRNDVRIVTNAYFFQEGTAAAYATARFGELRVADNGVALLVAMRDKDLKVVGGLKK